MISVIALSCTHLSLATSCLHCVFRQPAAFAACALCYSLQHNVGLAISYPQEYHHQLLSKWQGLQHVQCFMLGKLYFALLAGLTGLTSLNLQGCDMVTSQGLLVISPLTNLKHLDLDLCSKASGLQYMTGTVFK